MKGFGINDTLLSARIPPATLRHMLRASTIHKKHTVKLGKQSCPDKKIGLKTKIAWEEN